MNWLLIACLAIFVICSIVGYQKGFLRTLLALLSWVLVLVASYFVTPVAAYLILEHTPLEECISDGVNAKLNEAVNHLIEEMTESQAYMQVEEQIPEQLKTLLLGEGKDLQEFLTPSGDIQVDTAALSNGAAHIIGFVAVLAFIKLLLFLIEKVIARVEEMPTIGKLNTLLGVLVGAAQGLIWCWVVLLAVTFLAYVGITDELLHMVNESKILTWLYGVNPLFDILTIL